MSDKQEMVPALPSASVILVRDNNQHLEVLLVQRNAKIKFHGGAWVFPGGKFDQADHEKNGEGDELSLARFAAVRETEEEVGLSLDRSSLLAFSHWLTPVEQPKRFSTWFFISSIDSTANVVVDESEIVDHLWLTPERALERQATKELTLPPPTFVSLTKLKALKSANEIETFTQQQGFEKFAPKIVENEAGRVALYHGDAGFEDRDMNASGVRHRLSMQKSGWHYENNC